MLHKLIEWIEKAIMLVIGYMACVNILTLDFKNYFYYFLILFPLALLAYLCKEFVKAHTRLFFFLTAIAIPVLVIFWFSTDYFVFEQGVFKSPFLQDCAAIGIAFLIATRVWPKASIKWKEDAEVNVRDTFVFAFIILLSWFLFSVFDSAADYFKDDFASSDPSRFVSKEDSQGQRIAVSLSGGGYRAALVHAGALYEMEKHGVYPTNICSVSGGSIIGAYYALGHSPEAFLELIKKGRIRYKRELIKPRSLIRALCPAKLPLSDVTIEWCDYSRLDVQQSIVDKVITKGANWESFQDDRLPRLLINTTDLVHGVGVGFSSDYVLFGNIAKSQALVYKRQQRAVLPESFTLSKAVTVSGAFPVAFPSTPLKINISTPYSLSEKRLEEVRLVQYAEQQGIDLKERKVQTLLSDGGVLDNSGVYQCQSAAWLSYRSDDVKEIGLSHQENFERGELMNESWNLSTIYASNGGKEFDQLDSISGISTIFRAIDVANAPLQHSAIRQSIEKRKNLRHPVTLKNFSGDVYDFIMFGSQNDLTRKIYGVTALDGLDLKYPTRTGGKLKRASEIAMTSIHLLGQPTVLRKMASIHPDSEKLLRQADIFLEELKATKEYPLEVQPESAEQNIPDWDSSMVALDDWLKGSMCEEQAFYSRAKRVHPCSFFRVAVPILRDMLHTKSVFDNTATLQDQFTEKHADELFRYGRYVTTVQPKL